MLSQLRKGAIRWGVNDQKNNQVAKQKKTTTKTVDAEKSAPVLALKIGRGGPRARLKLL